MISYNLLLPPSTNELTFNLPKEKGGGRAHTKKYTRWIRNARWMLIAQGARPVAGKVKVFIELSERSGLDLDNCCKPVLDVLVAHGIIEDDQRKFVDGISLAWSSEIDGVRVSLTACRAKGEAKAA